jgi:hypothetical protein
VDALAAEASRSGRFRCCHTAGFTLAARRTPGTVLALILMFAFLVLSFTPDYDVKCHTVSTDDLTDVVALKSDPRSVSSSRRLQ